MVCVSVDILQRWCRIQDSLTRPEQPCPAWKTRQTVREAKVTSPPDASIPPAPTLHAENRHWRWHAPHPSSLHPEHVSTPYTSPASFLQSHVTVDQKNHRKSQQLIDQYTEVVRLSFDPILHSLLTCALPTNSKTTLTSCLR